ncbi:hypothetical protein ABFS83_05G086100 [Erythranthe nasuta]
MKNEGNKFINIHTTKRHVIEKMDTSVSRSILASEGGTRHYHDIDPGTSEIPIFSLNSYYESNRRNSSKRGKGISNTTKMIQSSAHGFVLESTPNILVDEDLNTIREITSDSGGNCWNYFNNYVGSHM